MPHESASQNYRTNRGKVKQQLVGLIYVLAIPVDANLLLLTHSPLDKRICKFDYVSLLQRVAAAIALGCQFSDCWLNGFHW
jgi:hypothetical protein